MSATPTAALVQAVPNPFYHDIERRAQARHVCSLEATSHSVDSDDTISWGAVVHDVSATGIAVSLCYPFRPGTYLSIDLQIGNGMARTRMVRVVHVYDQPDGQWRLGCEFIKP